ncbi:MAG: Manganese transport protein [Candidatus Gallionella acididurans]|uniref:Manganese transport protein n=1 Tax=Candidatus Gallionella acididurans TaxID=1796491 RepID=A0A139BUH2_9PROT|nr:MAG: Manganese transport protein [Candidatus Gallionella acididurans]
MTRTPDIAHSSQIQPASMKKTLLLWLSKLGPGLITGAADDDPSGIATYSQGGAQYGFATLWTLFLTYPLMVGIQVISARIGCVTGHGLGTNIAKSNSRGVATTLVALLLVANTINIGADLAAMADAVQLVAGGPRHIYAVALGLTCLLLQVFIPYQRYVRVLKWLTLTLFAYVGTVFASHVPWGAVLHGTLFPRVEITPDYLLLIVAIFGTTISPYLFFWQAGQEVEELEVRQSKDSLRNSPQDALRQLRRINIDTALGMAFSNIIAFFIMLTTAVTLYTHGLHDIQTSAQAAEALRPIGGEFTFLLFAAGIIGTGMLAVPVLAGSAAYAVGETFRWPSSLGLRLNEAKYFYAIIAIATLVGVLLVFSPIDPVKALLWSAMINGVISVPLMLAMMRISTRQDIMGGFVIGTRLKWLGWLATGVMAVTVLAFGLTSLAGYLKPD